MLFRSVSGFAFAGAQDGPQNTRDTVRAHAQDNFSITFTRERPAAVRVSGDGSTDLDCFVYDNGGHLVDSDQDASDECLLKWTPRWTGKFRIVVKNMGDKDNEYSLSTN